jgi:hypothetical protein
VGPCREPRFDRSSRVVLQSGGQPPHTLSAEEKRAWDQLDFFYKHGLGYAQEMAGRPQTLYAIEDSPIGLAAWILDHDAASYALVARVFAGQTEGLTRDDVLENITLYWLTKTAISSARLYWEYKGGFFDPRGVTIPVAVSAFPDEIYQAEVLGTASISEADLLQPAFKGRPLRSLGAAGTLQRRVTSSLPLIALIRATVPSKKRLAMSLYNSKGKTGLTRFR